MYSPGITLLFTKIYYSKSSLGCQQGSYDEDCMSTCPDRCLDNLCELVTGNCYQCDAGYKGSRCDMGRLRKMLDLIKIVHALSSIYRANFCSDLHNCIFVFNFKLLDVEARILFEWMIFKVDSVKCSTFQQWLSVMKIMLRL